MNNRVRMAEPTIGEKEKMYVLQALDEVELSGHGRHVREFEKRFAEYCGVKYAVMVPNGTIAPHLAMMVIGVGPGDEVVLPSQTISCFPAGTRILMENTDRCTGEKGKRVQKYITKPIEEITVGDSVLSFNEYTAEKESKKVTVTMRKMSRDFIKINFSNGNMIECTPEHPIAVIEGELVWKEARDVQEGDVCIQKPYSSLNSRLFKAGKTFEEIYGEDVANEKKKKVGEQTKKNWENGCFSEQGKKVSDRYKEGSYDTFDYKVSRGAKISDTRNERIASGEIVCLPNENQKRVASERWKENNPRHDPVISAKIAEKSSKILKERWRDPIFREEHLGNILKASKVSREQSKPTNLEVEVDNWLQDIVPGQFKYVGDGSVWINGANPDFIHCNGKKKAIEVFTEYWKVKDYGSVDEYKEVRTEQLSQENWEVLFIEDKELVINETDEKVVQYLYNPDIELVKVTKKQFSRGKMEPVYNLEVEDNNNYFAYGILVHNCVAFAVTSLGAKVVPCDVDINTWIMDPNSLLRVLTSKTKVVMPTPVFAGVMPDMDTINDVIREFEINNSQDTIHVIEDFAESIGSKYHGQMSGSFGDMGTCSLFANKNITTGEGGMITTNSDEYDRRLRYLRNCAYGMGADKFLAKEQGANYRPHNLAACIGLGQMDNIDYLISRRFEINRWYQEYLSEDYIWQSKPMDCVCVPWMNAVLVPDKFGKSRRTKFITYMEEHNIETRPLFPPIGSHPYLRENGLVENYANEEVSQYLSENGVLLPSGGPSLTREIVENVCQTANEFLRE